MILRRMVSEQIDTVKHLLDICFDESAWSIDTLRSQLEKPDSVCMVAIEDDAVVGFLAFEHIVDEGSIIEIAVHPDHRRRGIARRMIDSAISHAEDLSVVFLEVRAGNAPAIALYESLGFQQIAVRKNYYDHPKEDGLLYQRIVSDR